MKMTIEDFINNPSINTENIDGVNEAIINTLFNSETNNYFEILHSYMNNKKKNELTTSNVARMSDFPELTIKRFENMQNIPKITNLIKILNAVGLKLVAIPMDDDSNI